jgi:hypothetical protein
LAQELHHQAVSFSGVLDELASVVKAIFVEANYFLSGAEVAKNDAAINRLLEFRGQEAGCFLPWM